MAIQITFAGTVSIVDPATGTIMITKTISSVLATATVSVAGEGVLFGTGPTSITLPINPSQFVYVKNNHPTQTVTVFWTPNGGSSTIIDVLQPGSFLILSEQNLVSGISALALSASGTSTPVDFIIAG